MYVGLQLFLIQYRTFVAGACHYNEEGVRFGPRLTQNTRAGGAHQRLDSLDTNS